MLNAIGKGDVVVVPRDGESMQTAPTYLIIAAFDQYVTAVRLWTRAQRENNFIIPGMGTMDTMYADVGKIMFLKWENIYNGQYITNVGDKVQRELCTAIRSALGFENESEPGISAADIKAAVKEAIRDLMMEVWGM